MGVILRARPIGWLVVAAVVSVAVLGYLFVSFGPLRGGCSDAESRFAYTVYGTDMIRSTDVAVFSEGKEVRVTGDGQSGDASFNPDGSRIVYSTGILGHWDSEYGRGENGFEHRALFTKNVNEAIRVQNPGQGELLTRGPFDTEPDWSPDGTRVVFVREHRYGEGDDELWAVSVESKEEQRLLRLPTLPAQENQFRSPAWSPDGRRIGFFRARGEHAPSMRLWTMSADGSNARSLAAKARTGGDVTWSGDLSWSPDGKELAFDGQTEGASLHVFDLAENRARPLTAGGWPAWSPDGSRIAYFVDTSAGWEEGWTLTAVGPEGGDERSVQGAGPASFYAYQELDWVCM